MKSEKNRTGTRISAILLSMALLVSLLPTALAGNLDPTSDAMAVSYQSAAEGAVLLENNGILPLDTDGAPLAVFGRSQIDFIKGGGGSGQVNTNVLIDFIQGIRTAGFSINEDLYALYADWCAAHPIDDTGLGMSLPYANEEMELTEQIVSDAARTSDVAVVVIARNSTENRDHEAVAGDWYLQQSELDMLEMVNSAFDDVVVILNIGNLMDMNWVDAFDNISAILVAWQPGSYGTLAVGDILSGEVTPSGKLTDTWAYSHEDYPASQYGTFGVDVNDPVYGEDIYVGYRYFETFAPDRVLYAFGYGLSYTQFAQSVIDFSATDDEITVSVRVTNTGDTYSGKDVVQVYYSAPQGVLGKPARELAAYAKTDILAPGKSQVLTLSFDPASMASYDDSNATGYENSYVLEAGNYEIYAGSSVRQVSHAGTYTVDELTVTETWTEILAPTTQFQVLRPGSQNADGTYTATLVDAALRAEDNKVEDKWDTDLPEITLRKSDEALPGAVTELIDVYNGDATIEEYLSQLTLPEFVSIFGGGSGTTSSKALGAAGNFGAVLESYGATAGVVADGPAGLRLTITDGDTGNTAFPIATMLACTWNTELLEQVGEEIGKECAYNDVDGWLAPALNIHRDPFCGRNFEYYSEDPVVSGMSAAMITRGVQSQGVGVTLKHYAANSQEYNRRGSDSTVTERALREIYLKNFEIVVRSADPWYIMSAYNKVNGSYTASNYELCYTILREEWGFSGTVMTDWGSGKDDTITSMIRAVHDLCMPYLGGSDTLPDGFEIDGEYVVCSYCSQQHDTNRNWTYGWANIDPTSPCDPVCDRPLAGAGWDNRQLPDDCYQGADGYIYRVNPDGDDIYVCEYADWENDNSQLITGLVSGDITMGEMYRCAENIVNSLMQCLNFRQAHGLEKADYNPDDSALAFVSTREAVRDAETVTVTASAFQGGHVESVTVYQGADAEIPVTADLGSKLAAILVDGVTCDLSAIGEDNVFVIPNVESDLTLRALFVADGQEFAARYEDVNTGDWFYGEVNMLTGLTVVQGVSENSYEPQRDTKRSEFAQLMFNLATVLGLEPVENTDIPFTDMPAEDYWAAGVIGWAYEMGFVEGYSDTEFGPEDTISREDMALAFHRFLAVSLGYELEGDTVQEFADADEIDPWAGDAVDYVVRTGLMQGYEDGGVWTFRPRESTLRSEIATLFYNYLIYTEN